MAAAVAACMLRGHVKSCDKLVDHSAVGIDNMGKGNCNIIPCLEYGVCGDHALMLVSQRRCCCCSIWLFVPAKIMVGI